MPENVITTPAPFMSFIRLVERTMGVSSSHASSGFTSRIRKHDGEESRHITAEPEILWDGVWRGLKQPLSRSQEDIHTLRGILGGCRPVQGCIELPGERLAFGNQARRVCAVPARYPHHQLVRPLHGAFQLL